MRYTSPARHVIPLVVGLALLSGIETSHADEDLFESIVRPALIDHCFECHGQSAEEGGLRVDSLESLLKGGSRGPAIVAGDPGASLLVHAIEYQQADLQMPPKHPLDPGVADAFKQWIGRGANWPVQTTVRLERNIEQPTVAPLVPNAPSIASSVELWLQANAQPWSDGQPIYLWQDISGHGHDLAATKGARLDGTGSPATFVETSTINGFPAVRFSLSTGLGGNASTAPQIVGDASFTLFVVADVKTASQPPDGLLAGFGDPAPPSNPGNARCVILGVNASNGKPSFIGGWGNDALFPDAPPVANSGPVILTLTKAPGALALTTTCYVNGQNCGTATSSVTATELALRDDLGFFMGHARPWLRGFDGDIAEVVLFNQELDNQQRTGIEHYLSAKYRIPLAEQKLATETVLADSTFHKLPWAFQPLEPQTPPIGNALHPIDRFLDASRAARSIPTVEQADTRTLIRRLYHDLHGLPPTPVEMQQHLSELTPWTDSAWNTLIDKLLASPRYGERWGRHWLDVARYADTAGDNADYPIPEARFYRDYVIDSFNDDLPYDQFVREQIAGDLLATAGEHSTRYAAQVSATGFLALSRRYATGPFELWHLTLEDTIDTVGQAFLGMTMRCARCHDHKYDPIAQRDYYRLYGIFESTQYPWAGAEEFQSQQRPRSNFVALLPPDQAEPLWAEHHAASQALATLDEATAARVRADTKRGYPQTIPSAYAVSEGQPRSTVIQISGDPGKPGPIINRGVPTFLPMSNLPEVPHDQSGRLQLAQWLTDSHNPLTARVLVNRVWAHHFGKGLVASTSNFGSRGEHPSHPELLDWLATDFMEHGWSIKHLHRRILASNAWRLSSAHNAAAAEVDPDNRLLWHWTRQRLDAEAIRDTMLYVSGSLDLDRPEEHPFPPIEHWNYTQHNQFRDFYSSNHRTVYLMTSRLQRHPFLALFDGPDTNATTGDRRRSTVPSQALYLMNNEAIDQYATALSDRLKQYPEDQRYEQLTQLVFQRPPTSDEQHSISMFLEAYANASGNSDAWKAISRAVLTSHEAFHVE